MTIIEKTFDITTGEETITERDETVAEIAYREKFEAKVAQDKAEAEAKAAQKQQILDQLGITAEQAKLLLS
jgi:hypothetical protein